ncbi:hypothetical protein [Bradyrhizobium oligotrophicum]|uniref:hypothetical protein n=1 Tax=Bradyrhizobium oligotrophicum TaxID=44255 RepID=UPI003EB87CC0
MPERRLGGSGKGARLSGGLRHPSGQERLAGLESGAVRKRDDYIIVTDNRRDFLKEYAKLDVHAGLVILIPKGTRDEQMSLFQKALDLYSVRNADLVNKLIEVARDGSVHIREWTADDHDINHINDPKSR